MTVVSDVCTIDVINDASRSVNDASFITLGSRVMLQIVASLTIVIYNCNMFIVQVTGVNFIKSSLPVTDAPD
jgi:hypothetical protein